MLAGDVGWGRLSREDRDREEERDQLRREMLAEDASYEQIAFAITDTGDRLRAAWRYAHGWSQQNVADFYNQEVKNASMTPQRISDFERWPVSTSAVKPTLKKLGVLAKIYATTISKIVDRLDRQKMSPEELITLEVLDSGVKPRQLPATVPNFVGRTHELNLLTTQAQRADRTPEGTGPVVISSIGGTAGVGKTTLALHWTRTHIDQFPDGQLYIDLRGFSPGGAPVTAQEAIRDFLDAFQVPPERIPITVDAQAALYRTLLEDRRLVIVLDNARDADQIWPLLPGSPTCMVLVTSRQQLGSLVALKKAFHITLELMTPGEARQLLANSLESERIDAEPDAVDELIQYCVGLPLALDIAAARIQIEPHTSLSTLVGQLREQHQRLDALSTGEDSQLTNIRAVFSWSYTALPPQAARLFRLLGLHPGPDISTLAAASLAGLSEYDTGHLLTKLTQAYLVKQRSPGRYQFHDLLRAYASEQARIEEPEPQQQASLHRVLDYYLHTGVAADRYLHPHRKLNALEAAQPGTVLSQISDYQQAVEWFTAEHAVLLAATNYAATQGFNTHAWQLPWVLATFLNLRGHWDDQTATQQIALAAAERLDDHAAQAFGHRELGRVSARLGHYTDALASLQQALTLYQELGDHDGQAHTYLILGWVCERQGQRSQALTHTQHALDLYQITGNHIWQASALNTLGWYQALFGNHQQALTHCQQALNLHRELGNRNGEAATLDSLGYAHHHLGHYNQAISHYQQSIALFRELGDHYHEAEILTHLADTYHATGDIAATRDVWQQALAILEQLGHPDADTVRAKLADLDNGSDESTADN